MNTLGNFLYHYLGLQGVGPWYAWHSGIGGFEIAILTVMYGFYRVHRCQNADCWFGPSFIRRLGTHPGKYNSKLCHKCVQIKPDQLNLVVPHPEHGQGE